MPDLNSREFCRFRGVSAISIPTVLPLSAYQWRLTESLRSAVRAAGDNVGLMKSVHDAFLGKKPAVPPKVVIDAMASGAAVLQSSQSIQEVRAQHKNLVGIEMESYAVFCAAEYSSEPRPQVLSLKSVCDFGDDQKNDDFHEYAIFTSSEFLRWLLLSDLGLLGLA